MCTLFYVAFYVSQVINTQSTFKSTLKVMIKSLKLTLSGIVWVFVFSVKFLRYVFFFFQDRIDEY